MDTKAVVLTAPGELSLQSLELDPPAAADLVVEIEWSAISTGTERLLWSGQMPPFPGMDTPWCPATKPWDGCCRPGGSRGLPGASACSCPAQNATARCAPCLAAQLSRVVVPAARAVLIDDAIGERGVLLALAATAQHAVSIADRPPRIDHRPRRGRTVDCAAFRPGGWRAGSLGSATETGVAAQRATKCATRRMTRANTQ